MHSTHIWSATGVHGQIRSGLLPLNRSRVKQCFAQRPDVESSTPVNLEFQDQSQSEAEAEPMSQVMVNDRLTHIIRTASLAAFMLAVLPCPAHASSWRPRRHFRRMAVENSPQPSTQSNKTTTNGYQKTVGAAGTSPVASQSRQQNWIQNTQKSVKQAYRKLCRSIEGDAKYSVGINGRTNAKAYYDPGMPQPSPAGWLAAGIAVLGILYLAVGDRINIPWFKGGGSSGGRWVRDRSLGGRMIWVANTPKEPRPLWEEDEEDKAASASASEFKMPSDVARAAAAGAVTPIGEGRVGGTPGAGAGPTLPEWWDPPPQSSVYTPASRKEQIQQQVKAILRQMEDDKLLQGLDYPTSSLVSLRTLCQEGGIQVKASAENSRDAIYRTAVKAAIMSVSDSMGGGLGGIPPSRFVTGFARDLQVPDRRAVTIVHSQVAASCRSALIDAEAGFRGGKETDVAMSLIRMVRTLTAFPLPTRSAEADLVANSTRDQMSLEFRRAAFMLAGSVNLQTAPIMAELLGFDPQAVMPQLLMQMDAAEKAQAAQEQQQQQQ